MSRDLVEDDFPVGVTAFHGGQARGPCLQLTPNQRAPQLEAPQVRKLVEVFNKWLADTSGDLTSPAFPLRVTAGEGDTGRYLQFTPTSAHYMDGYERLAEDEVRFLVEVCIAWLNKRVKAPGDKALQLVELVYSGDGPLCGRDIG